MSDINIVPEVDPEIQKQEIVKEAEKIAEDKITKLKEDLISSIGGSKSEEPPKSWTSLKEETVAIAEDRILSKIEKMEADRERERKKREEESRKQEMTSLKEKQDREWEQISEEWRQAVEDGLLPDISAGVKEKLRVDPDVQKLTPEERADEGLKAYREATVLHAKLKNEGKSSSFYRTVGKFYNKQPAGANAPVLGSSPATNTDTKDYSYSDIVKLRRELFDF